ncbi:hypothetical protein B6K69_03745 [Fuscovulum blasticum]|nr:hypothetical protein B6K69_03745 [Fuscovulum blasticum]
MMVEVPNVVTEDGLRGLLAQGYCIEVICEKGAERRNNTWYGVWIVRAGAPDRRNDKMLVTSRNLLKFRDFRTISGLVSFLADMGCKTASIPLEQGRCEPHHLTTHTHEARR